MATIITMPVHYGPAKSARRRPRKNRATIVHLHRPSNVEPLYERASAIDADDPDLGRALYNECIRLQPSHDRAWTNLGNLAHRAGDTSRAASLFRMALELCPTQPEALYNLGYIELNAGNHESAVKLFRRSLASDPHFADCHFNLGCALENAEPATAAHHFRRYLELEPGGEWGRLARSYIRKLLRQTA
jgi:tetratricopeptide (TPR) repeat protein